MCAKEMQHAYWRGEIEKDGNNMNLIEYSEKDKMCRVCLLKNLADAKVDQDYSLYKVELGDKPTPVPPITYFKTDENSLNFQGQGNWYHTWFEDFVSPSTDAPQMQLVTAVKIYPIPGTDPTTQQRHERFAYGAKVYIGSELCGSTPNPSQMPETQPDLFRVLTVVCEKPIWGQDLTIRNQQGDLGFYSYAIMSAGVKLIDFKTAKAME